MQVLTVTVLSASLTAGSKLKVLLAALFRIVSNLVILSSNDCKQASETDCKEINTWHYVDVTESGLASD